MDWEDRIESNPEVLCGKPVIRGTRLAVEFILDLLSGGWTLEQLLENYPKVTEEDIRACMAYASQMLREARRTEKTAAA